MKSLDAALSTVTRVLKDLDLPYAVMGGLAVTVYAIPRFTNDVDLTVGIEREHLPSLFESLTAVGCEIPPEFRSGWLDSVAGLSLFRADYLGQNRTIEMDLFVAETPFQKSLIERRQLIETAAGEMWFVSPEDLVLLKLLASRPRDLIDVQDILFTMGQLDVRYLFEWAQRLSLTDALQKALEQQSEE